MTASQMIELICRLSEKLKSVIDTNEELTDNEKIHLDGLRAGLKLAAEMIGKEME